VSKFKEKYFIVPELSWTNDYYVKRILGTLERGNEFSLYIGKLPFIIMKQIGLELVFDFIFKEYFEVGAKVQSFQSNKFY